MTDIKTVQLELDLANKDAGQTESDHIEVDAFSFHPEIFLLAVDHSKDPGRQALLSLNEDEARRIALALWKAAGLIENGRIQQRAKELQAEGPDEFPTGFYEHLAQHEILDVHREDEQHPSYRDTPGAGY